MLAALAPALAIGLKDYADWRSVLIMCACEYILVWVFIRRVCSIVAGAEFKHARCVEALVLAELPTLLFTLMAAFGAPAYAISQMGVITLAAGGIIVYYCVSRMGRGVRFAAAGFAGAAFYIVASWALSAWIVRPPAHICTPVRYPIVLSASKSYCDGLNSFSSKAPVKLVPGPYKKLDRESAEFRTLRIMLSDILGAYYNREPLKVGYYRIAPELRKYRADDPEARSWDAKKLRAKFFISEIFAAEVPGAVEFRVRGRLRTIPDGAEGGAEDASLDLSVNIYRAAASPDAGAVWTVYYIRANAIN